MSQTRKLIIDRNGYEIDPDTIVGDVVLTAWEETQPFYMRVEPEPGYIYIFREAMGLYKIGQSIEPAKRYGQIEAVMPYELEVVIIIKTHDMTALENYFHSLYYPKWVKGEWYRLTAQDVADICEGFYFFSVDIPVKKSRNRPNSASKLVSDFHVRRDDDDDE